jgi:GTP-binding protein Era
MLSVLWRRSFQKQFLVPLRFQIQWRSPIPSLLKSQMSIMSRYRFPKGSPSNSTVSAQNSSKEANTNSNSTVSKQSTSNSDTINNKVTKQADIALEESPVTFEQIRGPSANVRYGDYANAVPKQEPSNATSLQVAMVGAPNAGKSTLVNRLVGQKVSIVSSKSQTTREKTIGVFTLDSIQLIFMDTPGIVRIEDANKIQRAIIIEAWNTMRISDIVLFIVDGIYGIDAHVKQILEKLEKWKVREKQLKRPLKDIILVLNKVDIAPSKKTLELTLEKLNETKLFSENFFVSALTGEGVDDLKDYLLYKGIKAHNHWKYDSNTKSISPDLKKVTEIIREQIFHHLYQELPYVVSQQNIGWTELKDGALRIDQELFVQKDSQKKIIIGKQGSVLRNIRTKALEQISTLLNRNVKLFLYVKKTKKGAAPVMSP